jgi:hypothetical protein
MVILKYWNAQLQIGFADWKNVYQFPQQQILQKEIHQCKLCYRLKGSSKRISYRQLKKGLIRKKIIIKEELPFWVGLIIYQLLFHYFGHLSKFILLVA